MVHGVRTGVPLGVGVFVGVMVSLVVFPNDDSLSIPACPLDSPKHDDSEHWQVIVNKIPPSPPIPQPQSPKVVRARFASTEFGLRDKLLVMILGQSSLTLALNASIGHHVPRMQVFVEASRLDADLSALPNLTPYRTNGQHPHIAILNTIFDLGLHESYDWFYLIPDTTYVNPFELLHLVKHLNWNRRVAIGGVTDTAAKCTLQAGILLSNPAMQSLIQQRHVCNSITSRSDHTAFEMCIHHATNLSCVSEYKGLEYRWWQVGEGEGVAIHDKVALWAERGNFNQSVCVSPLLSEADTRALHEHFVDVEVRKVDSEIDALSDEIHSLSDGVWEGPSWPVGTPPYSIPPNRHQVPKWEFFTGNEVFKNELNQNVQTLSGDDKLDIDEVVSAARCEAEKEWGVAQGEEFIKMQEGYRLFDAMRGMDYMIDLLYRDMQGRPVLHRMHLSRAIARTQLMHQVPYVKEDTDLTIVIPLGSHAEVDALRRLLARHARHCQVSAGDSRQTRIVVAARGIDPESIRIINNDLVELRFRCKASQTETMMMLLKSDSHPMITAAALDEAVDHFGQQMMYLLLSPHSDLQREFLDRVRINTIKHFQVFFPMPFVEYHPQVVSASDTASKSVSKNIVKEEDETLAVNRAKQWLGDIIHNTDSHKPIKPLVVHKDQGHFDQWDYSVVSLYGVDYMRSRARLDEKAVLLDVSSLFLGQSQVHVMRAVEPALRLRYHQRECDPELVDSDYARCLVSRREGLATKAQLANLLFNQHTAASTHSQGRV